MTIPEHPPRVSWLSRIKWLFLMAAMVEFSVIFMLGAMAHLKLAMLFLSAAAIALVL